MLHAKTSGNVSRRYINDYPEIPSGTSCIPGQIYRDGCNICRCTENYLLSCSLKGCRPDKETETVSPEDYVREKDHKRDGNDEGLRLPDLPKNKCNPGQLYKNICQRCYCDHRGRGVCTNETDACDRLRAMTSIPSPEDFGLRLTEKSSQKLPSLAHTAARCDPGKIYTVDCNSCLCLSNRNLLCTTALCISYEDMNRIEAKNLNGKPCKSIKDLRSVNHCIKCECKNKKFHCEPAPGCKTLYRKSLHGPVQIFKPVLRHNGKPGKKCLPTSIYKSSCNKCYCQESGQLICTLKICPTYVQSLILEKQRLQLEKKELLEEIQKKTVNK